MVTADGKACVDRNECLLDNPCLNGGLCINRDPEYECRCRAGFTGRRCGGVAEPQVLRLSMGALAAILVCLLIILSEWNGAARQAEGAEEPARTGGRMLPGGTSSAGRGDERRDSDAPGDGLASGALEPPSLVYFISLHAHFGYQ